MTMRDDDSRFIDRPFTHGLSLLPHPPSPPAIIAAVQAAAVLGPTSKLDRANAISNAFVCAPPTFLPLQDIRQQELQIIKYAFCDAYGITKPRDFQLQAIHYLCFYNNPWFSFMQPLMASHLFR
jgi:hypothetical protein